MLTSRRNERDDDVPSTTETDTQVLIVGAGPAGLMLASELRRHGVEHRLIDHLDAPTGQSRATDLQPRTLEILAMIGALPRFLERGFPVHAINIHSGARQIARMTFADLDTRFPHMLASSQCNSERALTEHYRGLGGVIERGVELLTFTDDAQGVTSRLRRRDGAEEVLRSRWVIGCDGAHSRVRQRLGLPFPGITYPEHHMLADARVTWDLAKDELHGFLAPDGHLLVLALPGSDEYRLFADIEPGETREPSRELFAEFLATRVPVPATIHEVTWTSRFRQHRRQVPHYRVGHGFLVGDAAHIHSIIPGQGANLAIQDAFNLAWKLALVCKGQAADALLDGYHHERHPIGRLTLQMTDAFHLSLVLRRRAARWLRDRLMPRMTAFKPAREQMSALCADLTHHYRGSPLVGEERRGWLRRGPRLARGAPRPGERAPDLRLGAGEATWLFDHLGSLDHSLLLFAGLGRSEAESRPRLAALAAAVQRRVRAPIQPRLIFAADTAGSDAIADPGGALHRRYGALDGGLYLIRPDGHVGFRGASLESGPLVAHLDATLRAPA